MSKPEANFGRGKKKGVYHLIQELIQEGKYAWFVNQEGRFRIKWEIAVERYIVYRAKKSPKFDLSIDRRKASNSFREALLRYRGDADRAKEYEECRTVGEKNKIVEREFQMPSTVFHSLFGPSEELPSDQFETSGISVRVSESTQVYPSWSLWSGDLDNEESSSEDRSDSGFETCNIPQVTYHRVEEETKRGGAILVDSLGFTYDVCRKTKDVIYWQCTVRPEENSCKASVTERDGTFQPGQHPHNHTAKGKTKALKNEIKLSSATANEKMSTDIFTPPRRKRRKKENSDPHLSLSTQVKNMQISRNESSSEDRSDSGFETCTISQDISRSKDPLLSSIDMTRSPELDEYRPNKDVEEFSSEDCSDSRFEIWNIPQGERLFSNYGAKTSLENQVKQLRDDVNDKLEYVGASLASIASVLREEKKLDQQLIEGETKLTEDTSSERLGERLFSNYGAKTSLENQVKQLHDDVNDKLEYVRAALVSIASVVRDEKKPDQQLIEGETKLTEDTSSERLEKSLSRSKIGEVKDSTSLEKVTSVLKDKQQTEEQRGEDESESLENRATSPSTIDKGKDSTSPEEVISVPVDKQQTEEQSGEDESEPFKETLSVGPETSLSRLKIGEVKDPTSLEEVTSVPKDKQQTEEQSGEDESESFEETLGENQATSPSTIDKGTNLTSLEEVISVPMDKQQTEEQSGEDKTESIEIMLGVGPAALDHDIKGKTTTFEAEHKECIRVLPYTNASGQVYVQLYVFCDKNSVPVELKEAAQEFFGETGVELKWTNLYNYASNIPNIVSKDFKQLEVSQANVISKIINKNLPVFSKHRNITAIQPSLKVTNSKQTNTPCIRVYVLGKGCIPVGESEIPNAVENCPVDIVDGFWLETLDIPKPLTAHKQEKCLRLGASIGVRGAKTAGTLGAIVKDDSKFYLLSCDHVINHEWEKEIIHPGGGHYLASLKYHLTEYQNWINRIIEPENSWMDSNIMPKSIFEHLKNQVNSFYNATDVQRHPKLEECERKLDELFSEKPRTVAHYKDGFRQNMKIPGGSECFIDVAIAELTSKEVEALKEKGYVEIIDTTNYPDGDVSRDGSQNRAKEWCKSGSATGYTTLKNHYYLKNVVLKTAEHERPSFFPGNLKYPETYVGDEMWRVNCLLFPHNQNVFSDLGDSGAIIFEKSEGQSQAMLGFGIVLGVIFSEAGCGTVAAPLFSALDLLYEKLGRRFTLVSKF